MPSLTPNDRLSLCRFSFADGRTCRTPRIAGHPNFCFYHAQREIQARAAAALAEDFSRLFSGNYVSANNLSAALSRLIPAVLQGHITPRTARTVTYMIHTLVQTIRLAQNEYSQTFGAKAWREAVANSVHARRKDGVAAAANLAASGTKPSPAASRNSNSEASSTAATPSLSPDTNSDVPAASSATAPQQSPSRPAHRQPQTVADALAIARSLFPPRPKGRPANPCSSPLQG